MLPVDYEAEYDNRAMVPEHPSIFSGWLRDAAAYRDQAGGRYGVAYGTTPRQTLDLFTGSDSDSAVALFVHGGYWRALGPSSFSHMAAGAHAHGITVAIAGYDLCPKVTISQIIDQIRAACVYLWRHHRQRVMVFGHSAGGHLAACMTATDWSTIAPDAPADLVPAGYAISGLFDLEPLTHTAMNAHLRLDADEAREQSPLFWPVPPRRTLDAIVGGKESREFHRQSEAMARDWSKAGAATRYEEIPGANHFTVLDPLTQPDSAMTRRVVALAKGAAALRQSQ